MKPQRPTPAYKTRRRERERMAFAASLPREPRAAFDLFAANLGRALQSQGDGVLFEGFMPGVQQIKGH